MLKKLLLPIVWWFRIIFSLLMKFFIYVGSFIGLIHTGLLLIELSCKGWKMMISKETLAGLGIDPKKRTYFIDLKKGTYYEVEVSQENAKVSVPSGTDDGVQDERSDDESRD
jgi:hypothetical protein